MWKSTVQPDRSVYTSKSHRKEPRGRPRHRREDEHQKNSYRYALTVPSGFTWTRTECGRQLLSYYAPSTNKMHTFQINVLIQFLVTSTCFERLVFVIRKTICTSSLYGMFICIYMSNLAVGRVCSIYCNRQGNSGLAWFRNGDLRIEGWNYAVHVH
jgi:hypothetical protein